MEFTSQYIHNSLDRSWLFKDRCGTQKLPKKFKIVETFWRDHSLESSWEALSDGVGISFLIQLIFGDKIHFLNFAKKTVLERVKAIKTLPRNKNTHKNIQKFSLQAL
jgi:hypothetical protein